MLFQRLREAISPPGPPTIYNSSYALMSRSLWDRLETWAKRDDYIRRHHGNKDWLSGEVHHWTGGGMCRCYDYNEKTIHEASIDTNPPEGKITIYFYKPMKPTVEPPPPPEPPIYSWPTPEMLDDIFGPDPCVWAPNAIIRMKTFARR